MKRVGPGYERISRRRKVGCKLLARTLVIITRSPQLCSREARSILPFVVLLLLLPFTFSASLAIIVDVVSSTSYLVSLSALHRPILLHLPFMHLALSSSFFPAASHARLAHCTSFLLMKIVGLILDLRAKLLLFSKIFSFDSFRVFNYKTIIIKYYKV